jgi:DNA-binding transcriptional LysR family regulator
MSQNPGVELQMDVTNKQGVIGTIEENSVDFSLVSILPSSIQLEKLDLLENKLYLVSNQSQKFKKVHYSKNLFKDLPLIYREGGSATRQAMEIFFEQHHVLAVKKMELTSNEAVKQAVLAGLGYSIMPLIGIRNELQSNELQIIPVNGLPIKTMWRLIWPKGKNHSPVASAFLRYVEKEKEVIVRNYFSWCEEYL